ncbi:unnamed protein product [Heligmosomoides polygyrus]|uniref:PaREP2b n=1 Tax=Heligmosomoides polygyrus TaxID=6339 RepID=A0A183G5A5_HELPZ|nr:unnamed protein product [Heligmosomoides polygyrus]
MENRGDDASIPRKMAWDRVEVAVEEIGIEVVDDFLHRTYGKGEVCIRVSKRGRRGLEVE